jgi:hypothetical protein
MGSRWARFWFGTTGASVALGVLLSVITATHNTGGYFHSPVERAFNTFAFFTI